jgi:hypothetical protein
LPDDNDKLLLGGARFTNLVIIGCVDIIHPTVIIDDVSVKLPKSVSDFLFSGLNIIGRLPVHWVTKGKTPSALMRRKNAWNPI